MHQGRLLECGKPDDLYTRPATRFVSTFLINEIVMVTRTPSLDQDLEDEDVREIEVAVRDAQACRYPTSACNESFGKSRV